MKKTTILVVIDGWGLGRPDESNPIYMANLQTIPAIESNFPSGALQASGISVGLPWEEEGNSEVGHLTIGAGMVLYQHFPRISLAIEDGSFFKNENIAKVFSHARKFHSSVHLVGLIGSGNVHSAYDHLRAFVQFGAKEKCDKLFLHLFTDGRDSAPRAALPLLDNLQKALHETGCGVIASVSGRYYGMDRDKHWDRTEKAYRMLTEGGESVQSYEKLIRTDYEKGLSDEYVEPTQIGEAHIIQSNDAVLFFNFREDRMRQIVSSFISPSFSYFPRQNLDNVHVATMTEYDATFSAPVLFPTPKVEASLSQAISLAGKTQLHIAETEKYAHVTYFFNGLREEPYENEFRVLIPSRVVSRHEEYPDMMAPVITDRVLSAIGEGAYDFVLVNYANPDIIAHSGNYQATVRAVRTVDEQLQRLYGAVLEGGHTLVVTSDHGNAEVVLDTKTGQPETKHNASPVPFYLVAQRFRKSTPIKPSTLPVVGFLSDVAPTILELMEIPKPESMTGTSLLTELL